MRATDGDHPAPLPRRGDLSIDLFDNFEPMWRSEMTITLIAEVLATVALAAIVAPMVKKRLAAGS